MKNSEHLSVLEAITPSKIGGAEVYVANICKRLPLIGAEVDLFCPKGRPFVEYAAKQGIQSISWKTHGKLDPVTVIKLARLIKKNKIDVIHTHLSTASLLGAYAAKLAGVPSVAHVHGMNSSTCFKHSTLVIAVSEAVKKHLCAQGLDESKVIVLHNGIDLAHFQPMSIAEAKYGLGYDLKTPVFGVFGRLSPEKGQKIAVEAFSILLKSYPSAQLILAGSGKSHDELRLLVSKLNISHSVNFVGFISDPRQVMSACDAIVVPSVKEGFGLAAVEAMALSRPVVCTNTGGLPEVVVNGETGFVVPVNNPQAIADKLAGLMENKGLVESMGQCGRRRAEECFDIQKHMQQLLKILSKC